MLTSENISVGMVLDRMPRRDALSVLAGAGGLKIYVPIKQETAVQRLASRYGFSATAARRLHLYFHGESVKVPASRHHLVLRLRQAAASLLKERGWTTAEIAVALTVRRRTAFNALQADQRKRLSADTTIAGDKNHRLDACRLDSG